MTAPHRNGAATSINFDAQALHDAEEAEYHREEEERQQEVDYVYPNPFAAEFFVTIFHSFKAQISNFK